MTKAATSACCNTSERLLVRETPSGSILMLVAYEKITKMRKAPMTIAPSTILIIISLSLMRGLFSCLLPSSIIVPRTVAVIAVVIVVIAVAKSQISSLSRGMKWQFKEGVRLARHTLCIWG